MLVECNYCGSNVDAEFCGSVEEVDPETLIPELYSLVKCPACRRALMAWQVGLPLGPGKVDWCDPVRVWPPPDKAIDWTIPSEARTSLEEARKCFKAKAYSACAVMCGRAIEAVCVEHTKEKTLAKGLSTMKDNGVIDGRLYEWGESLRHERNLGAHATGVKTTPDDARDVMDFAIAICEYVYVLTHKHEEYKQRKSGKANSQGGDTT